MRAFPRSVCGGPCAAARFPLKIGRGAETRFREENCIVAASRVVISCSFRVLALPSRRPAASPASWRGAGAGLRAGHDRALAALGRFRAGLRRAAQGPDHAGMPEGDSASSSRSRPSTPTTCRRASPRRSSPAPAPTSSWRSATGRSSMPRASPTSATSPRRSARTRAATTTSPSRSPRSATNGSACRGRVGGGLIAYRKSWFEEVGLDDNFPETWDELPRRRQEAEGQGPADRPDRGPHVRRRAGLVVSVPVVVGRQGGRGRRQDRRAEQQGDGRIGQVRGRALEGDACDEGGLAWDDTNNNRAFLSGTISATNNGASIYIEAKRKPDTYMTEKGDADVEDILHAAHPRRARRPVQPAAARSPTC